MELMFFFFFLYYIYVYKSVIASTKASYYSPSSWWWIGLVIYLCWCSSTEKKDTKSEIGTSFFTVFILQNLLSKLKRCNLIVRVKVVSCQNVYHPISAFRWYAFTFLYQKFTCHIRCAYVLVYYYLKQKKMELPVRLLFLIN